MRYLTRRLCKRILAFGLGALLLVPAAYGQATVSHYVDACHACGVKTVRMGQHTYCALSSVQSGGFNSTCTIRLTRAGWDLIISDPDPGETQSCAAICLDLEPSSDTPASDAPADVPTTAPTVRNASTLAWESEGDWTGTWRRRGTSNVFDVVYRGPSGETVPAVEELTLQGNQATGRRIESADGLLCNITGTVQADGRLITGTGACPGVNSGWWWRLRPSQ